VAISAVGLDRVVALLALAQGSRLRRDEKR